MAEQELAIKQAQLDAKTAFVNSDEFKNAEMENEYLEELLDNIQEAQKTVQDAKDNALILILFFARTSVSSERVSGLFSKKIETC